MAALGRIAAEIPQLTLLELGEGRLDRKGYTSVLRHFLERGIPKASSPSSWASAGAASTTGRPPVRSIETSIRRKIQYTPRRRYERSSTRLNRFWRLDSKPTPSFLLFDHSKGACSRFKGGCKQLRQCARLIRPRPAPEPAIRVKRPRVIRHR